MANQNTPEYMDKIKVRLFENMRMLPHAPGVQMSGENLLDNVTFPLYEVLLPNMFGIVVPVLYRVATSLKIP